MHSIAHATTNVPASPFITFFCISRKYCQPLVRQLRETFHLNILVLSISPQNITPFPPHPKKQACPLIETARSVTSSCNTLLEQHGNYKQAICSFPLHSLQCCIYWLLFALQAMNINMTLTLKGVRGKMCLCVYNICEDQFVLKQD